MVHPGQRLVATEAYAHRPDRRILMTTTIIFGSRNPDGQTAKAAKALLDDDGYSNAVHCLSSYRWHSMPRAQLALLWSGIEGLFRVDHELSFRLSLYAAKFLCPSSSRPLSLYHP